MRMVSARGLGLLCGVAVGMGAAAADAAILSLRAVKHNGATITTTNNLAVAPNDLIEANIFVSDWGAEMPLGVRSIQAAVFGRAGFQSGDNGVILPVGWEAPLETTGSPCTTNANCLDPRYPVCVALLGRCQSATHNPSLGSSIDRLTRTDFIHFGLDGIFQISNDSPDYTYVSVATDASTVDTGVPRYVGTLVLRVSANACGVFTISFLGNRTSLLADPLPEPLIVEPVFQPLVLTVGQCALQMLTCTPNHCTEDARMPHPLDVPIPRFTMNRFTANFSGSTAALVPSSFTLTQIPSDTGDGLPLIASVIPSGNNADIVFSRAINFPAYTCVKHNLSSKQCCFSVLPGDADASLFVQPLDAFAIIDNLDGQLPAVPIERCDINRSNLCTPGDLLTLVDLMNGANVFNPFLNATLQPCPDAVVR